MGELGWSSETGDNRKTKRSFGSPSFALERHMDGASKVSDSSTCSWWFCKKTETKNVMMGEMNIYINVSPPLCWIQGPYLDLGVYENHADIRCGACNTLLWIGER